MIGYIALPIVALAGAGLLWIGRWVTARGGAHLARNSAVDHHLLYQPLAACVAGFALLAVRLLVPESANYLRMGVLRAPVAGLGWMGAGPGDTWLSVGLTLGLIITAVTAIVVWLQAAKAGTLDARHVPLALLIALPFAVVNSAIEESIFRLALCNALGDVAPMMTVAVISGVLFGIPHYFGNPGKVPGVLLAGFLGWLMCLSVLQTQGIAWAWVVHCVQDVVILTLLFAVSATALTRGTAVKPVTGDPG